MALKIRIPFDKDFRNVGLNGAQPTAINTTIATTVGMDKCGSFNGSSSYLSLASGVDPTTSAFGFTTWVKVNSVSSNQCFFSQRNVVGQGYALFLLGTKMRFDTGANEWSMTTTFAAGVWYHIAVTYDVKKNVKNLYINGSLAETYAYNGAPISVGTNFTIGGSQSSDNGVASGNFLNGFLFDTRVYDNYLTAKDVSEIYACNLMDVCASSYYGGFIYDNSGFSPKHMEPSNIIFSGNSIYFNGTSSTIKYDGLNISGGTLSIWFNTEKKTTNFMCGDPVSHMGFAVYSSSTASSLIIPWIGPSPGGKRFKSTLINWGELNHTAIVYNESGRPETLYINGTSAAQQGSDYWSGSHTIASIGSRNNSGYFYKGYITRLTVYGKQFTADEISSLYQKGTQRVDLPDGFYRVEYIEFTGSQYIDTGYYPDPMNFGYEYGVTYINDLSSTRTVAGLWQNSYGTGNLCISVGGNYGSYCLGFTPNWRGGYTGNASQNLANYGQYAEVSLINNGDWDGSQFTLTLRSPLRNETVTFNNPYRDVAVNSFYIGAINYPTDGNPKEMSHVKVYYFRLMEYNRTVMNFVPISNGTTAGLFDTLGGKFYPSLGGNVNVGPAI